MATPLFPLPDLVLFPGVVLPLYVFEPRYRALLADTQASGEPFGILPILPAPDGEKRAFHERVARTGTYAHLRRAVMHEDGTSTIEVVGGERFQVEDFDFAQPYLSAQVRAWPLEADPAGEGAVKVVAAELLSGLLRLHPAHAAAVRQHAPGDPLLLASFAVALLPLNADLKLEALGAPTLLDRLLVLRAALPHEATQLN